MRATTRQSFTKSTGFQRGSHADSTLFVPRSTLLEAFRFHGKTFLVTHLNLHFTSSNNSNYVLELILTFKSSGSQPSPPAHSARAAALPADPARLRRAPAELPDPFQRFTCSRHQPDALGARKNRLQEIKHVPTGSYLRRRSQSKGPQEVAGDRGRQRGPPTLRSRAAAGAASTDRPDPAAARP